MKKFLLTLSAVALAAMTLNAAGKSDVKYVTTNYDVKGFTGIELSGVVEVQVSRSDRYSVKVEAPKEIIDYLIVRVHEGDLEIFVRNVPARLNRTLKDWSIKAMVSMPRLTSLEMSGATEFDCTDSFDLGGGKFDLEMSGASQARGLSFTNANADVEISGASKAELSGEFDRIEAEISGASVMTISGTARLLDMEVSGASKLKSVDLVAENVRAEVSGASKANVYVEGSLSAEVTGASSFNYRGSDRMEVRSLSVGRTSSAKRL